MIIEATYKGEPIEFFRAHKMRGNLIEADVNESYISLYGNELISKHFHCNDADYTVEEFVKYLIKNRNHIYNMCYYYIYQDSFQAGCQPIRNTFVEFVRPTKFDLEFAKCIDIKVIEDNTEAPTVHYDICDIFITNCNVPIRFADLIYKNCYLKNRDSLTFACGETFYSKWEQKKYTGHNKLYKITISDKQKYNVLMAKYSFMKG